MRSSAVDAEMLPLDLAPSESFPHPGRDHHTGPLDLNRHLIRRPASTFVVRLAGEALADLGLFDGDELVVDRALDPAPGRVVVVVVDGERRVGVMEVRGGRALLVSSVETIALSSEVAPWGVAICGIRHLPFGV
ncbi:DNA polymerase V [Nocardioides sp. BE266]|uniref:S24 family peptidase n=1 Tax=Nocardioides sp. BE266 TaxID=2817725 RepID=UPI0028670BB9|nr:S24 family peptidase [Nocardioides sp. BE266]MDR7255053.1 DNA polymerase V [Nocardioides sp. BE266]